MSDDGVTILTGPPIPAVLPAKGICVLVKDRKVEFFTLSRLGTSDMSVHTPVTFKNAMKFLWSIWKNSGDEKEKP